MLFKFFKSGKWILLAKKEQDIKFWDNKVEQNWIIRDDSASQIALAIMLYDRFSVTPEKTYMHNTEGQKIEVELPRQSMGGILLLPDFGNKNVDIGLSLILEFFHEVNPLLFSVPIHKWLSDYRPESVKQIHKRIREIKEKMTSKIEGINKKIQEEESEYAWIDMLLVGIGDDFKDSVGKALDFLGFKVNDIDKKLLPDERKREDFNLTDPSDESFYIVEAKSTRRGEVRILLQRPKTIRQLIQESMDVVFRMQFS